MSFAPKPTPGSSAVKPTSRPMATIASRKAANKVAQKRERREIKRKRVEDESASSSSDNESKCSEPDSSDESDLNHTADERAAKQNASVFYGFRVQTHVFWAHLFQHDKEFQAACLAHIRAIKDFKNYDAYDVMADMGEEWKVPGDAFKRTKPTKNANSQCCDEFINGLEYECHRIHVTGEHEVSVAEQNKPKTIPISLFPGCDIVFAKSEDIPEDDRNYTTFVVRIGVHVPVYVAGKPCTQIPDVVRTHGARIRDIAATFRGEIVSFL